MNSMEPRTLINLSIAETVLIDLFFIPAGAVVVGQMNGVHWSPDKGDTSTWPLSALLTVQLYDEFVSRGNVAVLKCLVLPRMASPDSGGHNDRDSLRTPDYVDLTGHSFAFVQAPSSPSASKTTYQANSVHTTTTTDGKPFVPSFDVIHDLVFEWRIKNGPAAVVSSSSSSSTASAGQANIVFTLKSNQTQGTFHL